MTFDLIEKYLNSRIKCDPQIVKKLCQVYLSAYTSNPINAFILAPSSEGKSYATVETSKLFPSEDIILIGRMSPTALIHQTGFYIDRDGYDIQDSIDLLDGKIADVKSTEKKEFERQKKELLDDARICVDLKNKIVIFLDNPNPMTYEMLKPIMSHDSLEIIYKTTKGDGSLGVKEAVIRNWPVFIFCSAKNEPKNEVWAEIKNRALMLSPNTNVEKYEEANKLTGQKFGLPSCFKSLYDNDYDKKRAKEEILKLKEKLNQLCIDGNNPILNPFHAKISELFPHNEGETMRHYTRFNSFVNLETLINSDYNPLLIIEKDGQIIKSVFATIKDIENTIKTMGDISTIAPDKIKFMETVFKPLLTEILNSDIDGLTTRQLADKYEQVNARKVSPKMMLENYCNYLEDSGILSSDQEHSRGEKKYHIASSITLNSLDNLKSNLLELSNMHESYLDSCLEMIETSSIQLGYLDRHYEYDNRIIPLEELKIILLE